MRKIRGSMTAIMRRMLSRLRRLSRLRSAVPDIRGLPGRLRGAYGAGPLHLLGLIACFALAGYAALQIPAPILPRILIWFGAAVIGHDLILFPLYALTDRSLTKVLRHGRPPVPMINHLRVPALGSALLFVVFLPGIIRQGGASFMSATGRTQQPYLGRWLLLTAAMFGISALIYAVRVYRQKPKPNFSLKRLRAGRKAHRPPSARGGHSAAG
jgi:hypothetical protein